MTHDKELKKNIEALLFFKGEPVTTLWLMRSLEKKQEEIEKFLEELSKDLEERGIRLLRVNDTVTLTTAPEVGDLIQKIAKFELERDLGKASLETLTIILYRGPLSKTDIDYIRGVNSNFILRALLIRGLVEREKNPEDERGFLYKPTAELLSYLGISSLEELPEYSGVREEIIKFEKEFANTSSPEHKAHD